MTQPPANLLLRVEQLMNAGKLHQSRLLLVDIIELNPTSARAWWLLSLTLTDAARQVDCLRRVLRLDPENVPARERLANLINQVPASASVSPFTSSIMGESVEPGEDSSASGGVDKRDGGSILNPPEPVGKLEVDQGGSELEPQPDEPPASVTGSLKSNPPAPPEPWMATISPPAPREPDTTAPISPSPDHRETISSVTTASAESEHSHPVATTPSDQDLVSMLPGAVEPEAASIVQADVGEHETISPKPPAAFETEAASDRPLFMELPAPPATEESEASSFVPPWLVKLDLSSIEVTDHSEPESPSFTPVPPIDLEGGSPIFPASGEPGYPSFPPSDSIEQVPTFSVSSAVAEPVSFPPSQPIVTKPESSGAVIPTPNKPRLVSALPTAPAGQEMSNAVPPILLEAEQASISQPEPPELDAFSAVPPITIEPDGTAYQPPRSNSKWEVAIILLAGIVILAIVSILGYLYIQGKTQGKTMALAEASVQAMNFQNTLMVAQTLTSLSGLTLAPTWTASPTITNTPVLKYTITGTPSPTVLSGPVVGLVAPDFRLTDVAYNQPVTLSQFEEQPRLLFFWTSDCTPCGNEMESIEIVFQTYRTAGLDVLSVNAADSLATISNYRALHQLLFPILLDPGSVVQSIYRVDVNNLPQHFFISPNGRIATIYNGEMTLDEIKLQVETIMRQYPTSTP